MNIQQKSTTKIAAVTLFYIIAVSLRYITNRTSVLEHIDSHFLKYTLQGIGPAIGALVACKVFNLEFKYSLKGNFKSFLVAFIIFFGVPLFAFSLVRVNPGPNTPVADTVLGSALQVSFYYLVYAIFEEIGWRGFLQEQLKELNKISRILIIAVMWYVWHLYFDFTLSLFVFFLFILFGTWGIGKVGDKTNSILVVGGFHALYNVLSSRDFSDHKYIAVAVCAIIWVLYLIFYDRISNKQQEFKEANNIC